MTAVAPAPTWSPVLAAGPFAAFALGGLELAFAWPAADATRETFAAAGFTEPGFDAAGFDAAGFDAAGFDAAGFTAADPAAARAGSDDSVNTVPFWPVPSSVINVPQCLQRTDTFFPAMRCWNTVSEIDS